MTRLDFVDDGSGNLRLSDRTFEECKFTDLELDPPVNKSAVVRECKFVNCVTSPGTCVIGSGVSLIKVVFLNLDCGDALRISSNATLNEVVVAGSKPKTLIVQPEEDSRFGTVKHREFEYQLDVSDFVGEVVVVGLRGDMVRKNPYRHVTIKSRWRDEVDWKGLGIGPFSYWRIFIKKLTAFNADEGVFSIPDCSDKYYAETMQEKKRLEDAGICFN